MKKTKPENDKVRKAAALKSKEPGKGKGSMPFTKKSKSAKATGK